MEVKPGRVAELVQELTAAESGDAALQEHSHFAEQLWDQTAVIIDRIAIGLATTEELIAFFKARQAAEEAVATNLRKMCLTVGEVSVGGKLGSKALNRVGANRLLGASSEQDPQGFVLSRNSIELLDVLGESAGSVRTAWGSMVYTTKTTAIAHSELAKSIQTDLIGPLEQFVGAKTELFKALSLEGKGLHKQLVDAEEAATTARENYYESRWQADPNSATTEKDAKTKLRESTNPLQGGPVTPELMYRQYEETVQESNGVQNSILRTKGLRTVLAKLEQLEHQRITLTKEAMKHFVDLTANWLPTKIGAPVVEEILPSIEAIRGDHDIETFCSKNVTGKTPGSLEAIEYDAVRDIPPSRKSLAQLQASGGGPIKSGWTYKEGHLVRNWKKRWFVLWPMNFKAEAVTGPSLYYFDDSESGSCPKGTLPIFGSTVGMPKKERKGHPWLVRIEGAKAGDGEEETKHDKLVFAVDSQEERDEWIEALGNASRGEGVSRLVTFGKSLVNIVDDQKKRLPESTAGVPNFFLDVMHQLEVMDCFSTEGLFRVPGDNDDVEELKGRYELCEYSSRDFGEGARKKQGMSSSYDVHVWGSFLKAWIRSLKDPVISEACYDEALSIKADGLYLDGRDGGADVVAQLNGLLSKLPPAHGAMIHQLLRFLSKIDPVASKMNAENLAIVFAPCLLRHPDIMVALANSSQEIAFTKLLIENGQNLGAGPTVEAELGAYAANRTAALQERDAEYAADDEILAAIAAAEPEPEPAEMDELPLMGSTQTESGFLMLEETEEEQPSPVPASPVPASPVPATAEPAAAEPAAAEPAAAEPAAAAAVEPAAEEGVPPE